MNEKIQYVVKSLVIIALFNQKIANAMEHSITIKPIQVDQAKTVKHMIVACAFELWPAVQISLEEFEKQFDLQGEFADLDDVAETYFNNGGTFLVLLDHDKVVGSGAIKKLTDEICEIKRVWFLKEYRGKGLGTQMMQQLLAFAQDQGYTKVRLDVHHPAVQRSAVALYKKLGFYEIIRYNNSPAQLFMEKKLHIADSNS